jgi:hypothetical protein
VGCQKPRGGSTIYQQQVRYIQNNNIDLSPSRLFIVNFVAQLQVWQQEGDRLLIFMDMNEHVLRGGLAKYLLNMGLQEATQTNWGASEPHTYIRGAEPINAIWFLPELDITSTMQLSFQEGVGHHRTVLVDISTKSAIGKQEFLVVHPHARQLNSNNTKARTKYLAFLERQMQTHWMPKRLHACAARITFYWCPWQYNIRCSSLKPNRGDATRRGMPVPPTIHRRATLQQTSPSAALLEASIPGTSTRDQPADPT